MRESQLRPQHGPPLGFNRVKAQPGFGTHRVVGGDVEGVASRGEDVFGEARDDCVDVDVSERRRRVPGLHRAAQLQK